MSADGPLPVVDVMEDCQNWLSGILSALFYGNEMANFSFSLPKIYKDWIAHPQTSQDFPAGLLDRVRHSADTVSNALARAADFLPPNKREFDRFMQAYEDFMSRINQVENDSLLNGHGVDMMTGFKTNSVLMVELKRELDRRARRGNPFSVAMLRIDKSENETERDAKLQVMAKGLRQCMRSFDDVYRLEDNDLLVGLKHSDITGGMRFVERLKQELNGVHAEFTFSSCVAEPEPGEDLESFLKELEEDLSVAASSGRGQSIKYEQLSPLQRFVSNLKENN